MATNKRITDLTDYTFVLPYASEMFGVYQPMIGWKSKRLIKRLHRGLVDRQIALLKTFAKNYSGALLGMLYQLLFAQLATLFYTIADVELIVVNKQIADMLNNTGDPFATFDPKKDIKNVSLSPLGIVHLFRQYFFELDTFLGTPTGHVWLSPGSMVELIE